jgi:4'-phosphopantetheinyl transferase
MSPGTPARWLCASERVLPGDPVWLTPREREWASRFRFTKRRDDYLLGRYVAKRAVVHALSLADDPASLSLVDVRNKGPGPERGAPEVFVAGQPAPLEISITDRAGWGVCMVGDAGARLGCDLELVEPRSLAFVDDYLTAAEAAQVRAATDAETFQLLANLLWCAKESALKVLRTGLRRDTRSVEVELTETELDGWRRMAVRDGESGAEIPGWWRRFGRFVLTTACEGETPPPVVLDGTTDLAAAEPSHAWMASPLTRA